MFNHGTTSSQLYHCEKAVRLNPAKTLPKTQSTGRTGREPGLGFAPVRPHVLHKPGRYRVETGAGLTPVFLPFIRGGLRHGFLGTVVKIRGQSAPTRTRFMHELWSSVHGFGSVLYDAKLTAVYGKPERRCVTINGPRTSLKTN